MRLKSAIELSKSIALFLLIKNFAYKHWAFKRFCYAIENAIEKTYFNRIIAFYFCTRNSIPGGEGIAVVFEMLEKEIFCIHIFLFSLLSCFARGVKTFAHFSSGNCPAATARQFLIEVSYTHIRVHYLSYKRNESE